MQLMRYAGLRLCPLPRLLPVAPESFTKKVDQSGGM